MILSFLVALGWQFAVAAPQDTARLTDGRITVAPIGFSFLVPPVWLGAPSLPHRGPSCGNGAGGALGDRILTEPSRLTSLRNPSGEWIKEYGATVDAALPFDALVAHLGGDPWIGGNCFAAIQIRIYTGSGATLSVDTARAIRTAEHYFHPVHRSQIDSAGWAVTRLSWEAWYYDYGATAHVEFWRREVHGRPIVIVFMFAIGNQDQMSDRDAILSSFREE